MKPTKAQTKDEMIKLLTKNWTESKAEVKDLKK